MNQSLPTWHSGLRANTLAGITSAFALVPECLSFALLAHVHPLMGLYGAFFICTITAIFGGRPGMISGAAGSMAVIIVALVLEHGVQYLLATTLLSGVIMLLYGVLRLGKLVRMVPHPVMLGFVNGLALVIASAQLSHFKTSSTPGAVWLSGSAMAWVVALVALTMLITCLLPRFTRSIPSALVAIISVGLISYLFGLPVQTLGDQADIAGNLPQFALPSIPFEWRTLQIILPYAVLMAIVGLLETLLTQNLCDEQTGTQGRPNQECVALGAANIVSSCFGGMGGCAMIGQTVINLRSGGYTRVSGIVSGVMVLMFILVLSPLIEQIPLAALAGVMLIVAQQTFSWASLRQLGRIPKADAIVIVTVTIVTVLTDLAFAVLCGIIITALNFAWQQARELHCQPISRADGLLCYQAKGCLFFASTTRFLDLFQPITDPDLVYLDCGELQIMDHSALAALQTLQTRYAKLGKRLVLQHVSVRHQAMLQKSGIPFEV